MLDSPTQERVQFLRSIPIECLCGSRTLTNLPKCNLLMPIDPEARVSDILKSKKGSIKNAPLEQGAPSWDELQTLTWQEIEEGAKQGKSGYRTIRKLLTDSRFNK